MNHVPRSSYTEVRPAKDPPPATGGGNGRPSYFATRMTPFPGSAFGGTDSPFFILDPKGILDADDLAIGDGGKSLRLLSAGASYVVFATFDASGEEQFDQEIWKATGYIMETPDGVGEPSFHSGTSPAFRDTSGFGEERQTINLHAVVTHDEAKKLWFGFSVDQGAINFTALALTVLTFNISVEDPTVSVPTLKTVRTDPGRQFARAQSFRDGVAGNRTGGNLK